MHPILPLALSFVCIGFDQAGIDCHALTADQTFFDAPRNSRLEKVAQQFALAEASMPVLGERRVIRDTLIQIEAAEPSICQVQMHLFAQPSLRADAEAIADQQHPDQQFRIDRWTTGVAVEIREMRSNAAQFNKAINRPKQVILGNVVLQ